MKISETKGHNFTETVSMNIDGRDIALNFRYRYHPILGQWRLSVYDAQTNECYVESIPLLNLGQNNLIAPFAYLGIGSCYVYQKVQEPSTDDPSEDNFGIEFGLAWGGISDG